MSSKNIHENRIGTSINGFKILSYHAEKGKQTMYKCVCPICGKTFNARASKIVSGDYQSCGCLKKDKAKIKGKKFGRLTVVRNTNSKDNQGIYLWECKCDCGKIKIVPANNLTSGNTKSCGCLKSAYRKKEGKKWAEELNKNELIDGTRIASLLRTAQKNNTSGYTGVSFRAESKLWRTHIQFKGTRYYLGSYTEKEKAIHVRKVAEENMHGNFLKWFAEEYPERWKKINKGRKEDEQN